VSNGLEIKVEGFYELEALIKKLPDKTKRSELNKIFGQVANPTLKVMRSLTPVYSGKKPKKRQIGKTVIEANYTPGYGKKTISKKILRRTVNAAISVGPHTRKNKDGYYLRQFVIPGTRYQKGDPFVDHAFEITQGKVTADSQARVAKYIQKQIDRLSKV